MCRRLAVSTDAGLDDRKIWQGEAERCPMSMRPSVAIVRDAIAQVDSLTDALGQSGNFFPSMFREMVEVGENTSSLPSVFRQLADHYEHRLKLNRLFLAATAWPMIQLGAALGVIGILILVMGALDTDMLGFGLTGTAGFVLYGLFVAGVAGGLFWVVRSAQRGAAWTRLVQLLLIRLPGIGGCLQKIALAQMSWVLHLTMNVAIGARRRSFFVWMCDDGLIQWHLFSLHVSV